MAIKKSGKSEYILNDVKNVKEWSDGGITLTLVVNGITIYGCRIIQTEKGDWFLSFPSRKGSDGKYYKHVWFEVDDAMKELIEAAVNKALSTD